MNVYYSLDNCTENQNFALLQSLLRPELIEKKGSHMCSIMRILILLSLFVLILQNASARTPVWLCAANDSICVSGVLEVPQKKGPHPAVIILHGSRGFDGRYPRLARYFADSCFVALALDYYANAGSSPIGSEEKLKKWSSYQHEVRQAVAYLQALPQVSEKPIALVGFSRGAFLAVSVANLLPSVKAVVDFFGGGGGGNTALQDEVKGFPPLLILHGEEDRIVPIKFATALRDAVVKAGGRVEMHTYPGEGHGLSDKTLPDALKRTILFLRDHLK
jgi:dienelactone hydrolase